MPTRFYPNSHVIVTALLCSLATTPANAGGAVTGGSTEWTQILNNGELISLVGKSTEQINNQVRQITQLATQIQNQIKIYENMLQNTARLPTQVWGQVEADLKRLQNLVGTGQGIAFSMGNIDDVLKQRFQSYANFRTNLPNGASFSTTWANWSQTNRDTIGATLRAANLTSEQFSTEEATMRQLRSMSETADGQMKALQVGHQLAAQQVAQMQQLRGLFAQQTTMMGTWFQSQQAASDLAQARRESFFNSTSPSTSGGQTMEPRW